MNTRLFLASLLIALTVVIHTGYAQKHPHKKPNIIFIMDDDLGYAGTGAYEQEKIETPNIDNLAQEGMKFTQFYAGAPLCSPSRYVLMTGKHTGHAYIRGNKETAPEKYYHDFEAIFRDPKLEGELAIPDSAITIAEVLKKAGYQTGAIGKWGIGSPFSEGLPTRQGFDYFYGYLGQRVAHNYYPWYLWELDSKHQSQVLLDNTRFDSIPALPDSADSNDPNVYDKYHDLPDYAPALMQEKVMEFITNNQNQPFFLYYPTTIPHSSMQAPRRWLNYYHEKFGDEEPYTGGKYFPVRYPHAAFAGLVSYMDEQIGKIVKKLKELNIDEDTIIMYTSDNGPARVGGPDPTFFQNAAPFKGEKGWGKGSLHEGGIRVPLIVRWPGVVEPGSSTDYIASFLDIMPTFSDLGAVDSPTNIDGVSFLPLLKGNNSEQNHHKYLYWEYPRRGGQQAVRMDRWKGLRKNTKEGNKKIQLFNMDDDMREQHNVAGQHPDIIKKMEHIMEIEHKVPKIEQFKIMSSGD